MAERPMLDERALIQDDLRWKAVAARDASADGGFVYAVATTGIYCRPSCPARRAKRDNVRFFASPAEADAAGYRPCRRCAPKGEAPSSAKAALIAQACRLIESAEEPPKLEALAARAGMSPSHFHRLFQAVTGLTPRAYAAGDRAKRARERLTDRRSNVTQAIYDAGFNASSRFYEASDATLGMTPTRFKTGGRDVEIRFAVGQCSLGAILVARSAKGICAISLGDDPEALVRALQDRFAEAHLIGADAAFERVVAKVIGLVEAPRIGLDLPLDLRGTAFQLRVWHALQKIPPGRTISYTELARRIGEARAVRAVAGACAANALAVAIPCHRVVRSDGSLSGYRWGIARKRALLDREREAS